MHKAKNVICMDLGQAQYKADRELLIIVWIKTAQVQVIITNAQKPVIL